MKRIILLSLFVAVCTLNGCIRATDVKPLFISTETLEGAYGIHAHITRVGDRNDYGYLGLALKTCKSANIDYIRLELDCPSITPIDGQNTPERFDDILKKMSKLSIDALGLISPIKWNIYNWQDTTAHKRYIDYMVSRYQDKVKYWEILNEVDRYEDTQTIPSLYTTLLKNTYNRIKQINPNLKVVYTGLSWGRASLLQKTIELGAADYFDVMNFHFYDEPEKLPDFLYVIKNNMKSNGWNKPLWITEAGCSTVATNPNNLILVADEYVQAQRLPRLYLMAFSYGVDKVFWYDLRSPEIDATDKEDYFGITHSDLSPKPAYVAYKALTKFCPEHSIRPVLNIRDNIYSASWVLSKNKKMMALWTPKGKKTYDISNLNIVRIYDLYGKNIAKPHNKKLEVSESIIYLQIK